MRVSRVALLASVLLIAVVAAYAADPCALTANHGSAWVGKLDTLKQCFTAVPLSKDAASKTLDAMESLADLYSFTDMARDSGAPYNIQVDLRGNLASFRQKLNAGGYTGDYAFHTDLMNMMNPLFDAHTLYRGPSGYQCFFLRPFNIEASVNNGQLAYTLRQGPLGAAGDSIWQSTFGVNPSQYANQVVTAINGNSVTQHVSTVAKNFISTYKDEGVRFNAALRGRWSQTILSMFPITDSNLDFTSTYTLANGQTVTIPNAGFCNPAINSMDTLVARNLGKGSKRSIEDLPEDPMFVVKAMDVHKEYDRLLQDAINALPASLLRRNAESVEQAAPVAQTINIKDYSDIHAAVGREFHDLKNFNVPTRQILANFDASALKVVQASKANDTFFMKLNDGVNPPVWIFKLTTFAPGDVPDTLNILNALLADAKSNNGQHLIADVAYNGGGIICLSDLILAMLVPEWRTLDPGAHTITTPFGIYDYKQSKSALALRANSQLNSIFTSYQNYLDVKTEKPVTSDFYNPIPRTRAGTTSNYTQQALFPAQCVGYPNANFKSVDYFFKSVTVLTDGTCGSACALFASQLQSNNKAKVVSYGGIIGRTEPLSTASFAGGNVLEYGTVATYAYFYGGGQPGLPPMMPTTAAARFNFNEYYEDSDLDTPREFLKRPADHHLDFYATFFASNPFTPLGLSNNAALYSAVAQTF